MNLFLLQWWSPFLPPASSYNAANVDNLYGFIFWLTMILFVLVIGPAAWFIYKYRLKPGEEAKPTPRITHHLGLELTWSVIPLILLLIIGVWSFWDFMALGIAPPDAEEIYVTGYKWGWRFEHKDGTKELNELHIPEGKKVKLIMTSEDVIHSFFIPDFRVKHDLPPGRYTSLWFSPVGVGEHQVFCTEYCGDGHSGMLAKIFVMPKEKYDIWAKEGSGPEPGDDMATFGKKLYASKGCNTCHSVDGSALTGPSFKGIYGKPQPLTTGAAVNVDEDFIRESILNPQAKIAVGYNPVMPSYQGVLKEKEIQGLIEYIKSLK
jgi:cytochrome c oxidase subunit II